MNQTMKMQKSRPGPTESVTFTDGMLVTAEDLNAAMRYPLKVMQVLNRAYFGCGIVCGLDVKLQEPVQGVREAIVDAAGREVEAERKGSFVVQIERGVALGCDGHPIELCEPVDLDLSPDRCGCPAKDGTVKLIAIRRIEAPEPSPRNCGCGPGAGSEDGQCSRSREHVLVQAFDAGALPPGICMEPPVSEAVRAERRRRPDACECLKQCPSCDRCAEPWVLIATVGLNLQGVDVEGINRPGDAAKHGGRLYVKPVACVCNTDSGWGRAYEELLDRLNGLEQRLGAAV